MKYIRNLLFITGILFTFSIAAFAQSGTLSGTVATQTGSELIPGVPVKITKLNRTAITNENGFYTFSDVPNGTYTVVTHAEGFTDKAQSVTVSGATTLDFKLGLQTLSAEVTVTATGTEESVYETFSSVNSVGSTRIAERASTAIGEILETEAGVSKRSFGGSGTGRPSIRGFEGDRVLVLQDGVRNGSVASSSGDHGEPVAALNVERLEIVKGPATLLYGSNAIGGVVNAVSNDENVAHTGLRGYFTGLGGTVNRQAGVAGGVEYGFGKYIANFDANAIREGDYDTPLGRIPNSGSRVFGGAGKFGYYWDKAFVRGSVNLDRRRYGIPYAPLFESGELLSIANGGIDCDAPDADCQFNPDRLQNAFANQLPPIPDEQIDIKMKRNNYRFAGGFRDLKGAISQGNFYVDFTDYQHQEIEAEDGEEEIATTFFNDVFSYRGVFQQAKYKSLSGTFGFDGYRRSYLTQGEEQLVDGRVRQNNFAVFGLQEVSYEKFSFQFGGRIENNSFDTNSPNLQNRNFTGFSGAFGVRYNAWQGGAFVVNLNSSYRSPALEELYNFGAHIGTITFEVGDQNLERERSNGVEFSFRQNSSRVRFNGSVFYYNIDSFIYLAPQDADNNNFVDVEDNLPIAVFTQNDSRYVGADASLDFDINRYVGAFVVADTVSADLTEINVPLPRITPPRLRVGLDLHYKGLTVRPEAAFVGKRDASDIFLLETPTAGYGLLNVNGSYAFVTGRAAHILTFGGQNLTDKLYRNHVNFIKDLVPEAGRGFKVSYTVRFY